MNKSGKTRPKWFFMDKEERKKAILQRLHKQNYTWSQIALELLNDPKKKSTVWSWAQRNIPREDLYIDEIKGEITNADQYMMLDILQGLYPRLDAVVEHLLTEIKRLQEDQKNKFTMTAGFLDDLEEKMSKMIKQAITSVQVNILPPTNASYVGRTNLDSPVSFPTKNVQPPLSPSISQKNMTPPPPPPPRQINNQLGTQISPPRTDFENMTLEDIKAIPPEQLESLSTAERGKLQARVKELRMIAKMSPKEREEYLRKKKEEKEKNEAVEGLGGALTSLLEDEKSLFARMKRAADESSITGSGTFGNFVTEYVYSYCFSCGKNNRGEEEYPSKCSYCGARDKLLVHDEEKINYRFYECLDCKLKEPVDFSFNRGTPIVVRSRWKSKTKVANHSCGSKNVREITSAVLVSQDPDGQFSYPLTLIRLYTQLPIDDKLKNFFITILRELQNVPDLSTKEEGYKSIQKIIDFYQSTINFLNTKTSYNNDETIKRGVILKIFAN